MNFNNQQSSDDIIDRELQGLRQPVESTYGLGNAIQAMQAPAKRSKLQLKWPIGIGSVAVAAGAVVLVGSLTTARAYAGDLRDIAAAQERQKTMHQKAYIFGGSKDPRMVTELWIDHNQEKFLQFRDGTLEAANVSDGKLRSSYWRGEPITGSSPAASIDLDFSEHFTIETISGYLHSDFFQKHSIEKTIGVKLNGRTCDLYNFAKGYYRIWVDPVTKLPIQREVYNKGVTLWERDVYEYPEQFGKEVFVAPDIQGMTYFDYPAARPKFEAMLAGSGAVQTVGGVTITLKAILRDRQSITTFYETSGDEGKLSDSRRLQVPGVRFFGPHFEGDNFTIAHSANLKNATVYLNPGAASFETIKVGVWSKDKFVGYAEFPYKNVTEVPSAGQLLARPKAGRAQAAKVAVAKDK